MSKIELAEVSKESWQEEQTKQKTPKKGGPYTKDEKDKRLNEVYRLHFEKGYSAIKISEMLNVNRNTVNEDIRYWYSELAEELNHDVVTWVIEQFHSFESQKNRLVDQLEKEESIQNKLAIEKMIFQINDKLSQFVSKIIFNKTALPNQKNEEEIRERTKDFVRYILLDGKKRTKTLWTKDDLLFDIIKRFKCDFAYANSIFNRMEKLGSKLCEINPSSLEFIEYETKYNVLKLAEMHSFLSNEEISQISKKT